MIGRRAFTERKVLLATVSAAALIFAWGPDARAADIFIPAEQTTFEPTIDETDDTFVWVAVEGRYNMFTDSAIFGDVDGYDSPFSLNGDPDDGWSGGLELGVSPAGSQWDFVGRLIYGRADGDDSYFYSDGPYYADADLSVEEEHITADFEVGRHIGVGGNTRIHAGLRFIHFDANADINGDAYYGGYYYGFEGNARQKITAIGPRIGIDQKVPLTENLSIDLSAAGAALFGERDLDASVVAYGYGPYGGGTYSESDDVTVWNAEASAALTFMFGNASLAAGYRVDAFWDLYEPFDGSDGDRITHGPFAKLKVYMNGGPY